MSATPIPTSDYSKAGVLDKWVKQPCDTSPGIMSNGEVNYREKWKGPYSSGRTILSSIKHGDTLSTAHSALGSKQEQYAAPSCPPLGNKARTWRVQELRVEESTAGDHCILYITYHGVVDVSEITGLEEDEEKNVWTISWQTYTVTPWEFCSTSDAVSKPWSPSYDDSPPTPDWSSKASRTSVEAAMNQNPDLSHPPFIVYTPDINVPDCRMYLDAPAAYLYKKAKLNQNAYWHYPIITHQTVHKGSFTSNYKGQGTLGSDIDVKTTLPSGCPYNLDSAWDFVKVGDDMTQVRDEATDRTTFTRQEMFMGVLKNSYDKNYYSPGTFAHTEEGIKNGRWEKNAI